MGQMFRLCSECGADRLFEPYHDLPGSCPDSADGDCPEWSCTECGGALLAGAALYQAEPDILLRIRGQVA
jgi:hypothetical protein